MESIKRWKKIKSHYENLYPGKVSFKNEGKSKTFSDT